VGLRAGLDGCGKSRPTGNRSPDRPARSESLCVVCLLKYSYFMYVPFCVIVLFFVLFVWECVLDYCHRDIGVFFDYPN
jgi:hypothetical protein